MALERKILEGENNVPMRSHYPGIMTGDTTPGVVGGYINTPNEDPTHSDDDVEADGGEVNSMDGQIVGDGILEQHKPVSRKMARRQKHEIRLERRYRRAIRGHMKQTGNNDTISGSNLIRARQVKPCSYCHVVSIWNCFRCMFSSFFFTFQTIVLTQRNRNLLHHDSPITVDMVSILNCFRRMFSSFFSFRLSNTCTNTA